MQNMKISVIGAGNIGTLIAGQLSKKNHQVTIYTRDKSRWNNKIEVTDTDTNEVFTTNIHYITESMKEAVENAELVFVVLPAFAIKNAIDEMSKYIKEGTYVCFYPGTGGAELVSQELIKKKCIIFGTQRVCSVVRLKEYGNSVITSGKRKEMFISSLLKKDGENVRKLFEELFDIQTTLLPNYLSVTLTPSNPILHTTRLYSLFKDYSIGKVYDKIPLFYENWDIDSSKMLMNCDEELHSMLEKLNEIDTSKIKRLLDHYESVDEVSLTRKISSIKGFQGLTTPSIKVEGGYIPDLNSRYFTADFPYGLLIIKSFALIIGQETPNIDKVIYWYQNLIEKEYIDSSGNLGVDSAQLSIPQNSGITSIREIYDFYKK